MSGTPHDLSLPGFTVSDTPRTSVQELYRIRLPNGAVRTVAILSKPGDRPVLAVTTFVNGDRRTRCLFHSHEALRLLKANRVARDPSFTGTKSYDPMPMPSGAHWTLAARRSHDGEASLVIGLAGPTGIPLGTPTTFSGDELRAIERAARALLAMRTA